MLRKARLVIVYAAGAMLLAFLAAHASPVRAFVLRRVVEVVRSSYATDLHAESLSYNLLTLSAELRGVRLAAVDTPDEPFAVAESLDASFGARSLIGDVSVTRLSLRAPRIDIRRHADGMDNLPRVATGQSNSASRALPPIRVDDLDVSFQQPSVSAALRGAAVQLSSDEAGRMSASIKATRGLTMSVGDRTLDFESVAITGDLDGERLDVRELTASHPGVELHATGSVGLRGAESTVDLTVKGSADQSWWAAIVGSNAPTGRVVAAARVTGLLSDPTVTFETRNAELTWPDVPVREIDARGSYSGGELSLQSVSLHVAGGTLDARGVIVLDDSRRPSRVEAQWVDIDARQIPGAAGLATTISKNGTAVIEWRADGHSPSPRIEVTATTGLVASGTTTPIVVSGSGHGRQWQVKASPRDKDVVDATAIANIALDSRRWQASTVTGRIELRTTDLPAVIRQVQGFGIAADIDPSYAAGAIDVDASVDGTLGAVRSTGRIIGRGVTLAGAPRMEIDASFAVDVSGKTSSGAFRLQAPALGSATFVTDHGVTLGGSLIATGEWSGPLSDPAIHATVSGRQLAVTRRGAVPMAATDGAFDGVFNGPVSSLEGEGKLTIELVEINDRRTGAIAADLAVHGDTVRIQARAPGIKATLDAAIGLNGPMFFEGRGSLAEYQIEALVGLLGLNQIEPGAIRGRVSSSIAFKGALRDDAMTNVAFEVAPIDAVVFDVPVSTNSPLRATVTGGQIGVEDAAITVGGLGVRLGGTLAADRSTGTLRLDVDGELGPLAPWLNRLSGSGDMVAAGHISSHLEIETSSAGLVTKGTVKTALTALSKGDRLLAKDVRAEIVLTGQRAEVRQATGAVLGGQITATADAPLIWLNQWLPSGFQIASSANERPARVDGTASFDAPALFALFERPPMDPLQGSIELSARLSAPSPTLAAIAGDLTLERAELTVRERKYVQSDVTRFRLADGALTIESLDWRGQGSSIVGRGRFGLTEGVESDVRLDLDTELGIFGALLSGRATGRLAGHIEVRGRSSAMQITSEATLSDASWLFTEHRILLAGWSGRIRLADQALSVTQLGGTVNGGSVRIDGRLPLEASAAGGSMTIAARDILIDVPRGLHTQLGGDLVWQQAERNAVLQGTVEITTNRYTEPVTRLLQLVNEMSSATRGSGDSTLPPWLARTALDINFAVTDPILIDNSVGTVELMPDLRLTGTVDSPALSGRVDVVDDGRITIGGRAYRMHDSQLRFAPADGLVPTLDAIGDTRIGDYDVTIRISGTPDRIETSFSSVPPLGERDLQSLIVTGQAGEQSTQGRQQSDDNFAAAAAATDILGFAGKFVGLDSVRIGAADLDLVAKDVTTAQHLTVSKSLGSSFDLIFSDNLEDGSVTWVLVWKPIPLNEIRASSVEDGTRSLEYRRSFTFGPGSPSGARPRLASEQSRTAVQTVQIVGTPGFGEAELTGKLELDAGNRFDVRTWIEDRHRLEDFYLDRGYHRVRIASSRSETTDRSSVSLTYDIERGPRTVIEITGDPLPGAVLDAMYEAWRGLPIADVVRTEFDRIAREGLARRGYYRPALQIEFAAETSDLARVTVHVTRGPQTEQLLVAWSGNHNVSNVDLDALVAPHRDESEVWLDSQALAWQVRQLYASRGHLGAQVTIGEPAFRDAVATLPITIDEGLVSRLADVRLEGVDPPRLDAATQALALSVGAPVAAAAPVEAGRRLKAFYAELGYRRAVITHKITTTPDGAVSIVWAVEEGPLYIVKAVNVVGAETTRDGLVQKAITVAPGAPVHQTALDTTRRNLYDIGSFRRVDFDFGDSAIQPGTSGELPATLTIQAEELQRFQLKYGVQYTFDRATGKGGGNALGGSVELRDRNFIGRALQASVGAHWDPNLQIVGLLLSSPRFLGKRVRTNVYVRDRREQALLDESNESLAGATLDDRRRELTFEQRWRPASALELVWGYNFSSREFLLDRDEEHADLGGLLSGPVVSVIVDKRDSPFDATRGLFHSSSLQFGVESAGSDLDYVRYLLRQSYYQPLGRLTAAGSVRYGTIQKNSDTTPISIIDLFFNAGGTNSVRGYAEDSLSAINAAGFALGGTDLLVLNGELRFPITKRFSAAAFVDAGNTFASIADITLGRLALGAGLGVRFRTPLAPLRLDFAHPFSNEFGKHGIRVHFSIGQMF